MCLIPNSAPLIGAAAASKVFWRWRYEILCGRIKALEKGKNSSLKKGTNITILTDFTE